MNGSKPYLGAKNSRSNPRYVMLAVCVSVNARIFDWFINKKKSFRPGLLTVDPMFMLNKRLFGISRQCLWRSTFIRAADTLISAQLVGFQEQTCSTMRLDPGQNALKASRSIRKFQSDSSSQLRLPKVDRVSPSYTDIGTRIHR